MATPSPRPHAPEAAPAAAMASPAAPSVSAAVSTAAAALVVKDKRTQALRGRSFLNHQQRLGIIKKRDEEPTWSQVELARWAAAHFHLPKEPSQGTIAMLLKKRDQLTAATVGPQTRTIRPPRHPELEAALLLWVRFLQSKHVPFTGENIRLKASFLAKQLNLDTSLTFSTGWMSGFVSRHGLMLARAHKKKHVEPEDEPVRAILRKYDPRDVFAMDETALIYNDLPFDGDHAAKANPNRDRFCVGLAVNMDSSEKLEPLVVTTCRRKVGVLSTTYYNVDANMTARIFEQWLYNLNQKMAATHRKIALIVDSKPSHFPLKMSNVRLVVLPSKSALRSHPMGAGITKSFKALYRRTHLSHAVDQAEAGQERVFDVSIPRALHWIMHAWHDVSAELIRSCWLRTGLAVAKDQSTAASEVVEVHPEVAQSLVVSLSQLQLLDIVPIETMLGSPSEQDAHYVYDDDTVGRIVAGEGLVEEESADQDEDMEGMTAELEKAKAGLKHATTQPRTPSGSTTTPSSWNKASRKDGGFHVVSEKDPTIDELLAHYRGVIWSLDVAPDHSDEHAAALRFLRKKQATLRLMLQHPRQYQAQLARELSGQAHAAGSPPSQAPPSQAQSQPAQEAPPPPVDTAATTSKATVEGEPSSIVL